MSMTAFTPATQTDDVLYDAAKCGWCYGAYERIWGTAKTPPLNRKVWVQALPEDDDFVRVSLCGWCNGGKARDALLCRVTAEAVQVRLGLIPERHAAADLRQQGAVLGPVVKPDETEQDTEDAQ